MHRYYTLLITVLLHVFFVPSALAVSDVLPGQKSQGKGGPKSEIDVDIFDVTRFSASKLDWGFSRPSDPPVPGRVSSGAVTLTKGFDQASNSLMKYCASGARTDEIVIVQRRTDKKGEAILQLILSDAICISYGTTTSDDDFPTEQVKLEYGEIDVRYTPQKAEGGVKLDCPEPKFCVAMESP